MIAEKESYKNAMILAMQDDAKTIAQKNEELVKTQSQMDVAEGVAGIFTKQEKRMLMLKC